jgi:hypothetical protein
MARHKILEALTFLAAILADLSGLVGTFLCKVALLIAHSAKLGWFIRALASQVTLLTTGMASLVITIITSGCAGHDQQKANGIR